MSIPSFLRFSMVAIFCFALIQFGAFDASMVQAQDQPEGPPAEGGDAAPPGRRARRQAARNGTVAKNAEKPKFVKLLDDGDLSQFRGYKSEDIGDGWEVDGEALHLNGQGGDLITANEYGDFDLRFDFKVTEGANSGVMYRVSLGDSASYVSGPEYQILDDANHADGAKSETSVGSLYALYAPNDSKKMKDVGEWNTAKIIVKGDHVMHYLNGKKVVDVKIGSDDWNDKIDQSKFKGWEKFGKNKSGHIAFQDHGNEVWFRNIKVKKLVDNKGAQARSTKMSKMKQMQMTAGGAGGPTEEVGGGKKRKRPAPRSGSNSKMKKMQAQGPGAKGPTVPDGG